MNTKPLIVATPRHTIIENTAVNFAAEFFEIALSQGVDVSKYKNHKDYARKNFTKFIPRAIDVLTDMLGNDNVTKTQKDAIYEALMERVNDPRMTMGFDNKMPDLDIGKLLDTKPLPPVIVNSTDFKSHIVNSKSHFDKGNNKIFGTLDKSDTFKQEHITKAGKIN